MARGYHLPRALPGDHEDQNANTMETAKTRPRGVSSRPSYPGRRTLLDPAPVRRRARVRVFDVGARAAQVMPRLVAHGQVRKGKRVDPEMRYDGGR
jgi:hypothetical protein